MGHDMCVPYRSSRYDDPKLQVKGYALERSSDQSLYSGQIIGIDTLLNHCHRYPHARLESEYSIQLIRPNMLIRARIPDEATRLAQSLGFTKAIMSSPEL